MDYDACLRLFFKSDACLRLFLKSLLAPDHKALDVPGPQFSRLSPSVLIQNGLQTLFGDLAHESGELGLLAYFVRRKVSLVVHCEPGLAVVVGGSAEAALSSRELSANAGELNSEYRSRLCSQQCSSTEWPHAVGPMSAENGIVQRGRHRVPPPTNLIMLRLQDGACIANETGAYSSAIRDPYPRYKEARAAAGGPPLSPCELATERSRPECLAVEADLSQQQLGSNLAAVGSGRERSVVPPASSSWDPEPATRCERPVIACTCERASGRPVLTAPRVRTEMHVTPTHLEEYSRKGESASR